MKHKCNNCKGTGYLEDNIPVSGQMRICQTCSGKGIIKVGKALTWDELAKEYNKYNSRKAYTLPMDTVFNWAEKKTDKFKVSEEGTIHKIL